MNSADLVDLVDEGSALDLRIKADQTRLKDIKAELCKLAPGEYLGGSGRRALVVQPSPGIKPPDEAIATVREMIGDEAVFKKLFERVNTWKAVKAFREVAIALMGAKKAPKVIELCEVEAEPYVLFK